MTRRERLPDGHYVHFVLRDSDGTVRDAQVVPITKLLHDRVIALTQSDESLFDPVRPVKPRDWPRAEWISTMMVGGCMEFDTPTKRLGPDEFWEDATHVAWGYTDAKGRAKWANLAKAHVEIARDVDATPRTIAVKR